MIEKDLRAKNELRVRTHGTVKFVPWLVRQIKVCGNSIYIHIRYTLSLTYCFEIHPIPNYKPSNQANCQSCNHQLPPMWFQSKKALMRNWTRRPIFHRSTQHAIQEGVTVKRASFYVWMLETPPNRLIITSIYYPDQFLGGKPENLMKLRTINWNFQNFPFPSLIWLSLSKRNNARIQSPLTTLSIPRYYALLTLNELFPGKLSFTSMKTENNGIQWKWKWNSIWNCKLLGTTRVWRQCNNEWLWL